MDKDQFFDSIRLANLNEVRTALQMSPELLHAKDSRGSTPLILASYYNHLDLVKLLLAHGADVNEKDSSQNTALMGVCFKVY